MEFLIGQRVIVDSKVIATVADNPPDERAIEREGRVWVLLPNGIKQWRSMNNVKPLPNGQL